MEKYNDSWTNWKRRPHEHIHHGRGLYTCVYKDNFGNMVKIPTTVVMPTLDDDVDLSRIYVSRKVTKNDGSVEEGHWMLRCIFDTEE